MHCLDGCLMISTVVGYVSSTFEGGRMGDNLEFFGDRKSTRLNSSHLGISYAVFCLKKKKRGLKLNYLNFAIHVHSAYVKTPVSCPNSASAHRCSVNDGDSTATHDAFDRTACCFNDW